MKTSIVLFGAGHLGHYHLSKIVEHPEAQLHAIIETDTSKHTNLKNEFDVPVYSHVEEMTGKADAAIIATPTSTHAQIATSALHLDMHVLIEKPICEQASAGEALCELAAKVNQILQVGHTERFNPAVSAALAIADRLRYFVSERLAPFSGRSTDVDVVLDLMIHDLDILLCLVSSPLKEIRAVGMPVLTNAVDMAAVRLEFEDGTVAQCSAGRASLEPSRKIRLFTEERYMSIDCAAQEVKSVRRLPAEDKSEWPEISGEVVHIEKGDALYLQLNNFIHAIQHNQKPQVEGYAGVGTLALAEQIKAAMANHQFV